VASSQPAESASTNKRGFVDGGVPDAVERYVEDLQRAPLATRTRDAYAGHVGAYGRWLTGRPEAAAALVEPRARDHAARDFKRHLKLEQGWKPASLNLALAAVDHFNRFLGLGPAIVSREPLAQTAPRALSGEEQRALLRATEDAKPRDRAIVVLLLYTALRLTELVTLDVGDARMSARKGVLVVRSGKGDVYREVPLNKPVRAKCSRRG
jgi:site-specific recombinase XerC